MTDYITPDDLRAYIGSDTSNFADHVAACCTVASRGVEQLCDRYFTQDATVSARYYAPDDYFTVRVGDISTTTGLLVAADDSYDGTYGTSWTITTDYTLLPVNPSSSGITKPYTEIVATGATVLFPPAWAGRRYTVKVTAKWGWAAVPDDVKHAAKILAAWLFKMKDAPDGFIGVDGWGPRFYRENPAARSLLGPYMRNPVGAA